MTKGKRALCTDVTGARGLNIFTQLRQTQVHSDRKHFKSVERHRMGHRSTSLIKPRSIPKGAAICSCVSLRSFRRTRNVSPYRLLTWFPVVLSVLRMKYVRHHGFVNALLSENGLVVVCLPDVDVPM